MRIAGKLIWGHQEERGISPAPLPLVTTNLRVADHGICFNRISIGQNVVRREVATQIPCPGYLLMKEAAMRLQDHGIG